MAHFLCPALCQAFRDELQAARTRSVACYQLDEAASAMSTGDRSSDVQGGRTAQHGAAGGNAASADMAQPAPPPASQALALPHAKPVTVPVLLPDLQLTEQEIEAHDAELQSLTHPAGTNSGGTGNDPPRTATQSGMSGSPSASTANGEHSSDPQHSGKHAMSTRSRSRSGMGGDGSSSPSSGPDRHSSPRYRSRGRMTKHERRKVDEFIAEVEAGNIHPTRGKLARHMQEHINPRRDITFYEKLVSRHHLNQRLAHCMKSKSSPTSSKPPASAAPAPAASPGKKRPRSVGEQQASSTAAKGAAATPSPDSIAQAISQNSAAMRTSHSNAVHVPMVYKLPAQGSGTMQAGHMGGVPGMVAMPISMGGMQGQPMFYLPSMGQYMQPMPGSWLMPAGGGGQMAMTASSTPTVGGDGMPNTAPAIPGYYATHGAQQTSIALATPALQPQANPPTFGMAAPIPTPSAQPIQCSMPVDAAGLQLPPAT